MKNKKETSFTAAYALFSGSRVSAFSPVRTLLAVFPSPTDLVPSSVSLSLGILASFLINYVSLMYSDVASRLTQDSVAFSFHHGDHWRSNCCRNLLDLKRESPL